jgi:hypothetical protein
MINHASLTGAGVVDPDPVFRSQRSTDHVPCSIDDADRSVKRKRNWSLALVSDHNCLARLIRCDQAVRVGRAGRRCCRRRSGCLFGSCGCLRKCKRCNGSTSQPNNYLLHVFPFHLVVSLLRLSPRGNYSIRDHNRGPVAAVTRLRNYRRWRAIPWVTG